MKKKSMISQGDIPRREDAGYFGVAGESPPDMARRSWAPISKFNISFSHGGPPDARGPLFAQQ